MSTIVNSGEHQRSARSLIVFSVSLVSLMMVFVFLLWRLIDIWLLCFGGILLAVGIHGLAQAISRWSPLSVNRATALSCWLMIILFIGGAWAIGPPLISGISSLNERLPAAIEEMKRIATSNPELESLMLSISEKAESIPIGSDMLGRFGDLFTTALKMLTTTGSAFISIFVIVLIAIYASLSPGVYTRAVLLVLPKRFETDASNLLKELSDALCWWLIGRGTSMLLVGVLTAVGLMVLGIPSALTLGLLAGLLSFIPNIGPVISAVPAVLVGLSVSPQSALWVVGLYLGVQTVESYLLTPLIQQRMVSLLPASVIIVQLAFGAALGFLGLLFATPLTVVAMVTVRKLWVERALGKWPAA